MTHQKAPPGSLKKKEHYDKEFVTALEELYDRTGIQKQTAFAEFLGISYVTYCNWRTGNYSTRNNFHKLAVEAYLLLSDKHLKALVAQRITE